MIKEANVLGMIFEQLQVFYTIICFVLIDMMHNFFRFKVSAKMLLHYKAMFLDIKSLYSKGMPWGINKDIPFVHPSTALPVRCFFPSFSFVRFAEFAYMFFASRPFVKTFIRTIFMVLYAIRFKIFLANRALLGNPHSRVFSSFIYTLWHCLSPNKIHLGHYTNRGTI